MLKAARSGNPATPSSFASLERSLERSIECLSSGEITPESKALLIEAKRLRSVVANWRSIPPAPDVHDEMLDRVLALSTQAGATVAESAPDSQKTEVDSGVPSFESTEVTTLPGDTEVYALGADPRLDALRNRQDFGPIRPAAGNRVMTPQGQPAVDYPPYRVPSEGQAYPAYPAEPQASYPAYAQSSPRSPADPMVAYPPLPAYPPMEGASAQPMYPPVQQMRAPFPSTPLSTPSGGQRRAYMPGEASLNGEPPVNDAPLAPETSVNVTPGKLPEKLDPHIVLISDVYSDRADAYRTLRRKLAASNNPRTIAITSPGSGEGKTTCAINLALAMREGARGKVLLLEANVRAPSLAKIFGFEPPECFVTQLSRHREDPRLPWLAVEPLPQLHVMAVDASIKHAPLLDPVAFSSGMERLKRAGYEYIVVDTPPVAGSFEVNMIADTVDGVLFVAIMMKSQKSAIRKAIEQVMPAPVLGVLVLDT